MGNYALKCKKPNKKKNQANLSSQMQLGLTLQTQMEKSTILSWLVLMLNLNLRYLVLFLHMKLIILLNSKKYCVNLHKNLSNRTLECERVRREISELKERNR